MSEYRSGALGRFVRTEEAEAEARRAYKIEQGRRWVQHNPNGVDSRRDRKEGRRRGPAAHRPYLWAARLEQLRKWAAAVTAPARLGGQTWPVNF
ncbi:hypothetical protein [Streptomyces sp. NPDC006335]|uniref:hypothetical protein n=1 Tax=Streptomyces sp. NPDC006335 TaxID=3156895 RepID=UPI0033B74260